MFGVKDLLSVSQNVRSTILLNLLSYMSDKLLTEGNTVAALDELYIWLSNPVAVEYIRNALKRVRKKNPPCSWQARILRTLTSRACAR